MGYRQGDDDSKLPSPPTKPVSWEIEVTLVVKVEALTFHKAKQEAELVLRRQTGCECVSSKPHRTG